MTHTQDEIRQAISELRAVEKYASTTVDRSALVHETNLRRYADLLSRLAQQKPSAWALDFGQGINTMTTFATQKQAASYAVGCAAPTVVVPLYAAPVPVAQQEPDAWMHHFRRIGGGRSYWRADIGPDLEPDEGYERIDKQPLYAAPVPAPKGEEGK